MKKYYHYIVLLIIIFFCFDGESQNLDRSKGNNNSSRPIESIIAYYEFNGNANDSTVNAYNGSLVGEVLPVADRFGNESSAYDFTNGEIQTVLKEEPDGIALWFKTTVGGNLITWGENENYIHPIGYNLSISEAGVQLQYAYGDGQNAPEYGATNIEVAGLLNGQWRHLIVSIDKVNGFMSLFIDGVDFGDHGIPSNNMYWEGFAPESQGMLIGSNSGISTTNTIPFEGQIDQLQLFAGQISGYGILSRYYQFGWPFIEHTLIASYDFSGDVLDISGNGFNAFNYGATLTTDRFGIPNAAFNFDGVANRIESSPVPAFEEVTLSAWFKTSADYSTGFVPIIDIYGSGGLYIGANNTLEGTLLLGGNFVVLTNGEAINDGQWHHATMTYDGNEFILYLDNQIVDSYSEYSGPAGFSQSPTYLDFGVYFAEQSRFFTGSIDDVKYYNYAINSSDVEVFYSENNWPNSSPIAAYFFNGNANDESGNGLNGTVVGATLTQDRFDAVDRAYSFNGSSYISVPDNALFSLGQTTDLAVSGWFNTTAASGVLFDKSDGATGYLAFMPDDGSNQLLFFAVQNGVGSSQVRSSAGYNDGNWHHFVMQMDRDGVMQIYIDGLLDQQDSTALSDGFNPDTSEDFLIGVAGGVNNAGLDTFFNGGLDDFQVFNQLLTQDEIVNLYEDGTWPIIGQVQIKINQAAEDRPLELFYTNSGEEYGNAFEFGSDEIQYVLNGQSDRPYGDNDNDGIIDLLGSPILPQNGLNFVKLFNASRRYEVAPINSIGFIGSAITGDETGWEVEDLDMQYIGGGVFELNNIELFDGAWKVRADNDWDFANWGYRPGEEGQLSLGTENIPISAGFYDIAVDIINKTYSVIPVSNTNLLASYLFNQNFNDDSGNGNNGTGINSTFGNDRFDSGNQAALFNGTDAYISIPDSPDLNFGTSEDIVISGWFRTTSGGVLFDKSNGSNGFFAMVQETGEIYFYMVETSSTTSTADVTTGKTYNDGEWHHYVIQITRATSMEIWVDGEVDAINEIPTDGINPDMTEDLLIGVAGGASNANLNGFFSGAQDDIRIFNQALALDEIQTLYSVGGWPIVPIPRIASISTSSAKIGEEISISGNNFSSNNTENIVSFNGVRASVLSSSSTELRVEVPLGASYGPIYVSVNDLVAQSSKDFNVVFDGNGLSFDSTLFTQTKVDLGISGFQQGAVISADFDQDGSFDLGVISSGTQFSVLRNSSSVDGEIIFETPVNFNVSSEIRIINKGDFDGDGKWDIAIAHGNIVSIFRNISSGAGNINFQNVFEVNLNGDFIRELEVADMNGDGKQDIVITERFPPTEEFVFFYTYTATILENNFDSNTINFSVANRTNIEDPFGFKLKDLNGDRKIDLVTTNSQVLLNIGNFQTHTFGLSTPFNFTDLGTTVEITTADYDNDGKTDFAVTEDNGARIIGVFANATTDPQSGQVNFIDAKTFETGIAPTTIKSADFDGDGLLDIASVDIAGPILSVFKNNTNQIGNITFEYRVDYQGSGSLYDLVIGDFNNDGKVDVISSDLTIFQNNLQSTDEISVPTNQATNLTFSDITTSSLTVNFNPASNHNGNYLVLRNNLSSPSFIPEDGVNYELNDVLDEDRVAYAGQGTSFIDSLLNQDTRYFYSVYSYNGTGAISKYLKASPLTGDEITLAIEQLATEPTEQPTNFEVSNFDEANKSFQVNYTAPATSVDGYLVVRALNENPIFVPMDGQAYSLGALNATDSIVYVGPNTQFTEQNILSDNNYQYLIFSYNGSEGSINYIQENPLSGNFIVPSTEPIAQPTNFIVNSIGPNSVNFSFTPSGSVSGYLVLRNESQIPVNVPEDFNNYQYGDQINEDVVIFSGSTNSIIDNNLNPSTQYFYAVFAFNGSGDLTNYLTLNPLSGDLTTTALPNLATEPAAQPTEFEVVNRTENSAELSFAASNASGYLIVRSESTSSFFNPSDGITYSPNSQFGNAFITYIGPDNTWVESGLMPITEYNFRIFAFNGTGNEINYLQTSPLQGQLLTLTTEPSTQASAFTVSDQTFTSFKVSFNADFENAAGYVVLRKVGDTPPTSAPVDGVSYEIGENLSEGEEIVAVGLTTEIEESNLSTGDTISYAIYSFNGEDAYINYNSTEPLLGTANTLSDNSAPSISNIQYKEEVELGGTVNITVTVIDHESGVEEVEIQYIVPGINNFENPTTDLMQVSGSEYSYEISNLTEAGLEFRINSKNGVELEEISSTEVVTVIYNDEGLTIPYSSFGTEESNYRIVSVPLTLNKNTINDIFGSQLGEYGDLSKWRMFRYSNDVTSELTGSTSLIPGRGYWLIVNDSEVTFGTGSGKNVTASVDQPYEIVLNPGWNQIGNPYPYDVSWSDIQEFNNEDFELRIFNGSFSNGSTLSAFSGGFVNWPNSSDFTLRIPKTIPTANPNRTDNGRGWDINLILENGNVKNELTGIGMHENANDELDSKDQFNLPHFLSYIDLNHPIKANGYYVAKNIVKIQDHYNWTFDIESNLNLKNTIIKWELPNTSSYNRSSELFLWDPSSQNLVDMKKSNQYQLRNSSGKDLKIIYGSKDYVNSLINLSTFQVNDPFPNPATGVLNLNYFIPDGQANSIMTMELYNLKGSLVNRKQITIERSGIHNINWDVNVNTEERLKGVYLLRINKGVSNINKKIVLR